MNLDERLLCKADPLLREALSQAKGNEVLRAVVTLRPPQAASAAPAPAMPPGMNRADYRAALIRQQQDRMEAGIGPTLRALSNLQLRPCGGSVTPVVIIEGPAAAIGKSLELDGVRHASLDRAVHLTEPVRRARG